jgi:hypothetical protein
MVGFTLRFPLEKIMFELTQTHTIRMMGFIFFPEQLAGNSYSFQFLFNGWEKTE